MSHKQPLYFSVFIILFGTFFFSCTGTRLKQKENSHITINENKVDSSSYYTILPYRQKMDATMSEVVAKFEDDLTKDQPEGNLGNFVCDCLMRICSNYLGKDSVLINGVLLNNGGLRTSIPKGNVTIGKIYELMPFDNELAYVELSGKKTKEMLDFIAAKGGMPVAGIKMEIENNKAKNVFISGVPFDENKHYYFISSDYLINGGDNMDFFKGAEKVVFMKKLLRDAIIEYCKAETKKGNVITAKKDGRISIAK